MKKSLPLALIVLILVAGPIWAGDDLDLTFGTAGKVTTSFSGSIEAVAQALALQSDGKIVVAGFTQTTFSDFALVRYNNDGSLDATFGSGGKVTTDFSGKPDGASTLALQSDGKIVVAGGSFGLGFALARYNSDGSLDATFGKEGKVTTELTGPDDYASAVALQSDGRIIAAGPISWGLFALARYNSDGSLDATFGSGGKVTTDFSGRESDAYALALQSDGKIVVAGLTQTGALVNQTGFALARYNGDGSLDATFGSGGKVTTDFSVQGTFGGAYALGLQLDGKIVAGGDYSGDFGILRYNSDGSLDTTFGKGGIVQTHIPGYDFQGTESHSRAQGLVLQLDGKIVSAGAVFFDNFTRAAFALARHNTDGSLDTTFGAGGTTTTSFGSSSRASALAVQPDGKIVAAGFDVNDFAVARYKSDGRQRFIPVTPCRVVDTRNPDGPFLTGGATRAFVIRSAACGIPTTAKAYSINVTVVPHGFLGYITLWPTGWPQPLVSTLNAYDGQVTANAAIVPAGTGDSINAYATDATDLILDINGYFLNTISDAALLFYPLTPCRVSDTRNPPGPLNGPILGGGETRAFPILSSACGIPAKAQAYVLNATAVPSGSLGYLTLWPAGMAQPLVSTLNAYDGQVTANMAIVPAGTGGAINAFATQNTHLVLDVTGYFAPPDAGALSFFSLTPCRVLDTRNPPGPLGGPMVTAGTTRNFPILSSPCGAPPASQAYSMHTTVAPFGPLYYLTVWPAGVGQPLVSTLNAVDGQVTSNSVVVPAGTGGAIGAFVTNTTDLIFDISGFFAP